MPRPYAEEMAYLLYVSYTPYDKSPMKKDDNIITCTQFEEGNLLSETRDDTEIGNNYYENSTMPKLISKEEMDATGSSNESDD